MAVEDVRWDARVLQQIVHQMRIGKIGCGVDSFHGINDRTMCRMRQATYAARSAIRQKKNGRRIAPAAVALLLRPDVAAELRLELVREIGGEAVFFHVGAAEGAGVGKAQAEAVGENTAHAQRGQSPFSTWAIAGNVIRNPLCD
jgi:hypothetical protein